MIVRGDVPGELSWLEQAAHVVLTRDARAVVAEDDGRIVGMVAFDGWTQNAAQAHMAVAHPQVWVRLLRPAFQYAFQQAGRGLLIGVIPAGNVRSVRFTEGIGFHLHTVIADGWAEGEPLMIYRMRREECRFLRYD